MGVINTEKKDPLDAFLHILATYKPPSRENVVVSYYKAKTFEHKQRTA